MAEPLASSLRRSSTDPEQFGAVYEAAAQDVLVSVARRVLDPELALEIVAETFARAYLNRSKFRGETDGELARKSASDADE